MVTIDRQYAVVDDALVPIGATVPLLEPGFYEYTHTRFGGGVRKTAPVSDDLIDIPGTPADEIIDDIVRFLATKSRYELAGLTHKRGYLLFGPPGTGKTSIGLMIGRRFVKSGGVVFHVPGSGHLSVLTEIIKQVEPGRPCMFLMEEADGFVNDVTALSILDGEQSLAGAVFVAMTNHKEKMPPRIANRPGRFDRVVYVGAPPRAVQVAYFDQLLCKLGEDTDGLSDDLADALSGLTISMGHLREAFIAHVLMDVPLDKVRERFELMAQTHGDDPAPEHDVEDDDIEDDDDDYMDDDYSDRPGIPGIRKASVG